jgi:hypothetical protein
MLPVRESAGQGGGTARESKNELRKGRSATAESLEKTRDPTRESMERIYPASVEEHADAAAPGRRMKRQKAYRNPSIGRQTVQVTRQ